MKRLTIWVCLQVGNPNIWWLIIGFTLRTAIAKRPSFTTCVDPLRLRCGLTSISWSFRMSRRRKSSRNIGPVVPNTASLRLQFLFPSHVNFIVVARYPPTFINGYGTKTYPLHYITGRPPGLFRQCEQRACIAVSFGASSWDGCGQSSQSQRGGIYGLMEVHLPQIDQYINISIYR